MSKREYRHRFGERLRRRREAAQLTQAQLARKMPGRVEGGQVSRWERGESFPTYANFVALARALGISEEVLLGPNEEPARRTRGAA